MAAIQFKRGLAARWKELNLVLAAGEPGFVLDENRFKIGNGVTPWNDLPYMGESNIFSGATKNDFPEKGYSWVIYKAEEERKIYQWNATNESYEELSLSLIQDENEVLVLYGGSATDNIL